MSDQELMPQNPLEKVAKQVEKAENAKKKKEQEQSPRQQSPEDPPPDDPPEGSGPAVGKIVKPPEISVGEKPAEIDAPSETIIDGDSADKTGGDSFFQPTGDPFKYRFTQDGKNIEFVHPESGKTGTVSVEEVPDKWMRQVEREGHLPDNVSVPGASGSAASTQMTENSAENSGGEEDADNVMVEESESQESSPARELTGETPEDSVQAEVAQRVLMDQGVASSATAPSEAKSRFQKIVRSLRNLQKTGTPGERLGRRERQIVRRLSSTGTTAEELIQQAGEMLGGGSPGSARRAPHNTPSNRGASRVSTSRHNLR
jgi:hypothetical protein